MSRMREAANRKRLREFPWPPGSWQAMLYEGLVKAGKRRARKAKLAARKAAEGKSW